MLEQREARVVVGIAESLSGLQALRYAVQEARRRGLTLRAVRAWQFDVPWRGSDIDLWRQESAELAATAVRHAFDLALGGVPPDLAVEFAVAEGDPAAALVACAEHEDDVLVIGASHRHGWRSYFGVTRWCVRRASCPVIVVPPPALARERRQRALVRDLQREVDRLVDASLPDATAR
ncbi:MAG TPA: universal stress protein [Micromonosporaceae bacterium]